MTGENLTAQEIIAADTPQAEASFARLCDRMARALGAVINLVDPDVIVLGGGLSNIDALYTRIPQIWSAYIFSDVIETKLVKNAHGDASGVRGQPGYGRPTPIIIRDARRRHRLAFARQPLAVPLCRRHGPTNAAHRHPLQRLYRRRSSASTSGT